MMNANGFAIYANLMLTMYNGRPQAMHLWNWNKNVKSKEKEKLESVSGRDKIGKFKCLYIALRD